MPFAEIFAKRDDYCVWLDWKTGIEEALHALRNHFGSKYSFLHDEKLDAVADNYAGEELEEQMKALGQQLTVYGAALYNLDRGSDEYGLFLVAQDDMEAFEAYAGENGHVIEQLRQPRKKFGSIAKKIKLSEKLPYALFNVPVHSYLKFAGNFVANTIRHYTEQGGFSHKTQVCYNLETWPPKKSTSKEIINYVAYNRQYGIWAAIFGEDNTATSLRVSSAPFEKKSWTEIPFPEKPDLEKWATDPAYKYYHADVLDVLTEPLWVGPDLLLAYTRRHKPGSFASVTHVWAVPNAANGGTECYKVTVTPPCALERGEYPHLAQTGNDTYVLLSGRFYTWANGELLETGIEALAHTDFHAVATGPHTFAYVSEGRLVEVDMRRSCSRFRELKHLDHAANVRRLNDKWAVLLRHGYPSSALDIAQFWHIETDQWLRLSLGAFGKDGISDMVQLDDGAILVETVQELCKVDDLWVFLVEQPGAVLEMPAWDADWSSRNLAEDVVQGADETKEIIKGGGFWAKLKAWFGRK